MRSVTEVLSLRNVLRLISLPAPVWLGTLVLAARVLALGIYVVDSALMP